MRAVAVLCVHPPLAERLREDLHRALGALMPRVGVLDEVSFACDLRGTERLLGAPLAVGRRVLALCDELALSGAVGIAAGPFVARTLALRASTGSVHQLRAGEERAYLSPLPLSILPLDPAQREEFALLGIHEVGSFAALDPGAVLDRFGRSAAAAHALARGEDPDLVHGRPLRRRVIARRTWDEPIDSRERLVFALRAACDEIAAVLAPDGLAAMRLVLRLERERAGPLRLERLVLPPSADAAALLRSLRWGLEELTGGGADLGQVLDARVEAAEVEPLRGRQIGLFAPDGAHLDEALAVARHLRTRLGPGAVLGAEVVDREARFPEREARWKELVG